MSSPKSISKDERGSAFVEFLLCFSFVWVPLFFGTAILGFSLLRAMQVTQVCRDAGHMYAYGVDFSQSSSQTILSNLATGMTLSSSGNSYIVLSTITYVDETDCKAAGLTADGTSCPNMNKYVFFQQFAIGNSGLGGTTHASAFGTPSSSIQDSSGVITPVNRLKSASALAHNFPSVSGITLVSGQKSYVSEMYATPLQPILWSQLNNPFVTAISYF